MKKSLANLFDRRFQYQGTDFNNPAFIPGRSVFARFTLVLQ